MKEIVNTNDLRTDYWKSASEIEKKRPELDYDAELDTLYLYFVSISPNDRVISHYLDRHVSFLFRASDNEIVGMAFERFMKGYLPTHKNKPWSLAATGVQIKGIKDFLFRVDFMDTSPLLKFDTIPNPMGKKVQAKPVFA